MQPCIPAEEQCRNPQKRVHNTTGTDEYLQGTGSDPMRSISRLGLRVPNLATPPLGLSGGDSPTPQYGSQKRYLFQTFAIDIGKGCGLRITDIRQYAWLGALTSATRPTEMLIGNYGRGDPSFHIPGGDISWHLRVANRGHFQTAQGIYDIPNFKRQFANTGSALLYDSAGVGTTFPAANLNK